MNRKIGIVSSIINLCAVISFALCMLIGTNIGSYLVCMAIAFSFVPMMCAFCAYSGSEKKVAGYTAIVFAGMYAVFILQVYFAQITTVRLDILNEQAMQILDYQKFGLYFDYDLLGYGLMALATFFAGLAIEVRSKCDKWLKTLLMIHGVFFVSCFIIPMLGLFTKDMRGGTWIGTAILEFWCVYFAPISILSIIHFMREKNIQ